MNSQNQMKIMNWLEIHLFDLTRGSRLPLRQMPHDNLGMISTLLSCLIGYGCFTSQASSLQSGLGPSAQVQLIEFLNLPLVGRTKVGQSITLGGFSGLQYIGRMYSGAYRFVTLTDRGPNVGSTKGEKIFPIPGFTPQIVLFELSADQKSLSLIDQIPLRGKNGNLLSGLPWNSSMEKPLDIFGSKLPYDLNGLDPEAICLDSLKQIWIAEEYGPSVCKFDWSGKEVMCLTPGHGLPQALAKRKLNKGFEGLACKGSQVFAFMQSPLPNEGLNGRIIEIDATSQTVKGEYLYQFESKDSDKVGDATVLDDGTVAVLERDSESGPLAFKKVFKIEFDPNTPIVKKTLYVDLVKSGLNAMEKTEGLAFFDGKLAIINDNDFGISGDPNARGEVTPTGAKACLFVMSAP